MQSCLLCIRNAFDGDWKRVGGGGGEKTWGKEGLERQGAVRRYQKPREISNSGRENIDRERIIGLILQIDSERLSHFDLATCPLLEPDLLM